MTAPAGLFEVTQKYMNLIVNRDKTGKTVISSAKLLSGFKDGIDPPSNKTGSCSRLIFRSQFHNPTDIHTMTTKREAKIALTLAWDECRPEILSSIAAALSGRLPATWVNVTSVLPQGLPTRSWRSLWKNAMEVGLRTTEYVPVEGYYLLRHKFGNSYFVWVIPRSDFSGELDALVDRASTSKTPERSIPGITELQDDIDSECVGYVEKLNNARLLVEKADKAPSPRKPKTQVKADKAPSSPRKRKMDNDEPNNTLTKKIRTFKPSDKSAFEKFSILKEVAFSELNTNSNRLDVPELRDEKSNKVRNEIQPRVKPWEHC